MRLDTILNGIALLKSNVSLNTDILQITSDHRKIKENSIFVAIKGTKSNGVDYISYALKNGAKVIITQEKEICNDCIPYILVDNTRSAISKMLSNYYSNPTRNMKIVAITGTNGKTSSAYLLYNIVKAAKISCGLISTIECLVNDEKISINNNSTMTTPEPETLYSILDIMKKKEVDIVIMEASSHALDQNRLDGLDVEIGAFTNLTCDHFDYHKNIDNYFKAKEILMKISKLCVVNADDVYGYQLLKKYSNKAYGYSIDNKSDFYAINCETSIDGSKYCLKYNNDSIVINSKLLGKYNVYNSMLAASCAKLLNIDNIHIVNGIKSVTKIKGRMERYKDKNIFIDYAHTPDAMKKAIELIKNLEPQKRIITLFGCGGDRDKSKRAEMGKISTDLSDFAVITSDNSRSENPYSIITGILKGISPTKSYTIIPNRREAIINTVKEMKKDDILLLLGKGHEEYEITQEGKLFFDERKILDEVFNT